MRAAYVRAPVASTLISCLASCSLLFDASIASDASGPTEPQETLNLVIEGEEDDGKEGSDEIVHLDSDDLELGFIVINATRFTRVQIPRNSLIEDARVQFTAETNHPGNPIVRIHAENTDDSLPYVASELGNLSTRERTSESVLWTIPAWTDNLQSEDTQTENLAVIVQELVDRDSWQSTSTSVSFFFLKDESGEAGDHFRSAHAKDGNMSPARLTIVFRPPSS